MILLDTDHASILMTAGTAQARRLDVRLRAVLPVALAVGIPTVEEQMRGWLARLARDRAVDQQVATYGKLVDLIRFFAGLTIAPFDDAAAIRFASLGSIRIGTMDRKIAAIALATDSLLLTANRRDFERVPGLTFANWLD